MKNITFCFYFVFVLLNPFLLSSCMSMRQEESPSGLPHSPEEGKGSASKSDHNISMGFDPHLMSGDVIRVGRSFSDQENFLDDPSSFPMELDSDRYEKSNFQSQAMGVDEYLKTSLVVGQKNDFTWLKEGWYQIAVLRKNRLICTRKYKFVSNENVLIGCPEKRIKKTDLSDFDWSEENGSDDLKHQQPDNGAELRLLDNSSSVKKSDSYLVFGQKIRLRVFVPAWNSTDIVEMYSDGQLEQRWVLERGDISKPYSVNLEKNLSTEKNFHAQFKAWGNAALPDFLTGEDEKPFAQTPIFCVKVKPDSECDLYK